MLALVYAASMMLDTHVKIIDGEDKTLKSFDAKAMLIVNVASKCGYTPQYFPSNDFGAQEPGTESEIKELCKLRYGVTFPLAAKVKVKGDDKAPIYKLLTKDSGEVKWNFTKFLVDASGKVLARFESGVEPLSAEITQAVEAALK